MLLWVAFYFGIFLPGHDRGAITLPGGERSGSGPACPLCISTGSESTQVPEEDSNQRGGGGCCAICQSIATLDAPPTFAFDPPEMGLLDLLDAPVATALRDQNDLTAVRSRGPPTA